jgi:CBS domain-containing protein
MRGTRNARRGSSVIEYTLMLSLVTGAVLLIAMTLGHQAKEVLGKLGEPGGAEMASGPSEAASTNQKVPPAIATQPHRAAAFRLAGLFAIAVVMVGSAIALSVSRRRDKTNKEPTEPKKAPARPQPGYIRKRQEILRSLATAGRSVLHNQLAAEQIMSRRLTKVLPDTSLDEIQDLMRTLQLRHVLVCDKWDGLLGVISDRDTLGDKQGTARDIMTPSPITIEPETTASVLVSILLDRRISCLPVVHQGTLLGIVTTSDIAMTLQCTLQLIEQMVSDLEGLAEGISFVVPDAANSDESAECSLSA